MRMEDAHSSSTLSSAGAFLEGWVGSEIDCPLSIEMLEEFSPPLFDASTTLMLSFATSLRGRCKEASVSVEGGEPPDRTGTTGLVAGPSQLAVFSTAASASSTPLGLRYY